MPFKKHLRFPATAILAALMVTLAVALPGVFADGDEDKNEEAAQGKEQALPIPEKAELKYPNLGSHLDGLVVQVEEGETTFQDAASDTRVHAGELVAVTIYLTGSVDEVVSFLEDNGGDPRNVGEDYIEAYVPVTLLGQLSDQPGVIRVRKIIPPEPEQSAQRVTGRGPAAHLSAAWNQAGYTGQGVKVGVIDAHLAFNGFRGLMGTELPSTVRARCYTDIGRFTQDLADCEDAEDGGNHGTQVAEAVVDIAPEVSLYIATPLSKGDHRSAVDWMVSEGVKVIVWAGTRIFDGPGDGTSPYSDSPLRTVDRAVAGGAVWVNAAGNEARRTWFARAPFRDSDGDGFIEFAGFDEVNDVTLKAGDWIRVQLRWDDSWGGASTDLNLGIQDNVAGRISALSIDPQTGAAGHIPYEFLVYPVPVDSSYGVVLGHASGSVPDWIQLLYWGPGSLEHYTKNGSIGNPAESTNLGMLAVGAAHWNDVHVIEPYSSRGPTPHGRPKPDVVGVACGATALISLDEYNEGFCGTSQAAPHVAGMAALVRQRLPSYTPAQVASYLKDNAEQRQSPDPNNTWGHGFAKLPPPDGMSPTVSAPSNVFTRNPTADFNTLAAADNVAPLGIWSDGETMWVADWLDEKIYAYDMATKARVSGKDFNTLEAAENTWPEGIWSDGGTMWVADWLDEKIYAYDMATKARVSDKDFNTLEAAENTWPEGIWSDGETMWVADWLDEKIYAYDMATKARVSDKDFNTLKAARNVSPEGIWSDGTTMWVADSNYEKVYAYDMATKARVPGKEFNTLEAAGNWDQEGIWSDGTTMLVADLIDGKIYAYYMPQVESAADREALVTLYNATGGGQWINNTNWLTNAPVGQWYGVTTDVYGRVNSLSLPENGLTGEIPVELGNLTGLTVLDLNANQLSGEIPGELGSLTKLTGIHITNNQLSGEIPSELPRLTRLETLALGANQLTGTIPIWLGNLTDLEELHLWGNQLTGEIPEELGSLTNLTVLSVSDNQLTGEIPEELGSLTNLTVLSVSDNQLTGEIPEELGSLTNLTVLSVSDNQLTGEIPEELGSLTNLTVLSVSDNQLTGTIPTRLGSLTDLEELHLWGNQLTGEIPEELGSLTNLTVLSVSDNQLTGTIPTRLGSLTDLEELRLWGNQLTGEIPEELGNLAELMVLSLSRNDLTGEIPTELGELTNLARLVLNDNQLTGPIPPTLSNLAKLEELDLGDNQLTGHVPTWLSNLTNLEELYFTRNQLAGPIPPELGGLVNLSILALGGNGLTGEIPAELSRMANLKIVDLSDNQLTGEIPGRLGDLTNLTELFLWGNQLTGEIPESLTRINGLTRFLFYNNSGLCAPVASAFQEWLESIADTIGSSCATADSAEDRAVLVELHRAAGGIGWGNSVNWLSDRPLREWYGVVNDASGRVTGLFLFRNQLTGTIPIELGNLASLELLTLKQNQLTGKIPPELGNLANLRSLSLRDNQLSGEIPPELGSLDRLELLWLFNNQLTGEIPAELGNLTNLTSLRLDGNRLNGTIPAELGGLTNLTVLYLAGNQLTGCVPAGLRDVEYSDFAQLGLNFCTSGINVGIVDAYDKDNDGVISPVELSVAINDYLNDGIGPVELSEVIAAYLAG